MVAERALVICILRSGRCIRITSVYRRTITVSAPPPPSYIPCPSNGLIRNGPKGILMQQSEKRYCGAFSYSTAIFLLVCTGWKCFNPTKVEVTGPLFCHLRKLSPSLSALFSWPGGHPLRMRLAPSPVPLLLTATGWRGAFQSPSTLMDTSSGGSQGPTPISSYISHPPPPPTSHGPAMV